MGGESKPSAVFFDKRRFLRTFVVMLLLAAAVFASRVPFLSPTLGGSGDSERLLIAAEKIGATGEYHRSRSAGYPIVEYVLSSVRHWEPFYRNALTALMSSIAAVLFALTMSKLGIKDNLSASLALAFTPAVFITSTYTIDFIWALTFMLGCFYLLVTRRPLAAGILLGLATGCRITTIAMLLPFSLLAFPEVGRRKAWRDLSLLVISTMAASALSYLPAFLKYGSDFFHFADIRAYPSPIRLFKEIFLEVWGVLGSLALVIALLSVIFVRKGADKNQLLTAERRRIHVVSYLLAIVIQLLVFLRLPHKGDYLIPIVPFVILLACIYLPRKIFIVFCSLLIISPFLLSFDIENTIYQETGLEPGSPTLTFDALDRRFAVELQGPILQDFYNRGVNELYCRRVIAAVDRIQEPGVVVAGHWLVRITYLSDYKQRFQFREAIDKRRFERLLAAGYRIYYLHGVDDVVRYRYGYDIKANGAEKLETDRNTVP